MFHINGTSSSDPGSFHKKVEAGVHKKFQSIASRAKIRLSEANKNVATLSEQLSELKIWSALNASQNAFKIAYPDLQTTSSIAIELQNNLTILSNIIRQLEDRLVGICDEETCSHMCISGFVLSHFYKSVAVPVPYPCSIVNLYCMQAHIIMIPVHACIVSHVM